MAQRGGMTVETEKADKILNFVASKISDFVAS